MDVHGIEIRRASHILIRKVKNLSFHQHALVGSLIELNKSAVAGADAPPFTQATAAGAPKRSKSAKTSAGVTDWLSMMVS